MAIDFPNSPTFGQTFTSGNNAWTYNGTYWEATTSTPTTDLLSATGDMVYAPSSYNSERLPKGTTGYPLVAGASVPGYAQLGEAGVADSAVTDAKVGYTAAKIRQSYSGSASNNVITTIYWDTELSDPHNFWTSGQYLVVPSGLAGLYAVCFQGYTGYGSGNVYLYVNGTLCGFNAFGNCGFLSYLAVGDQISAAVMHQGPSSYPYAGEIWVVRMMA